MTLNGFYRSKMSYTTTAMVRERPWSEYWFETNRIKTELVIAHREGEASFCGGFFFEHGRKHLWLHHPESEKRWKVAGILFYWMKDSDVRRIYSLMFPAAGEKSAIGGKPSK